MITCVLTIINVGIPGAFWRAAFVAALAVSVFVLARYWTILSAYPKRTRYLLLCLRGVPMLLLAAALTGGRLEYQVRAPLLVVIHRQFAKHVSGSATAPNESEVMTRLAAQLKRSNVEIVEEAEYERATSHGKIDQRATASIVVTDGAMRAPNAMREVENASDSIGGGPVFVLTGFESKAKTRVALESISVVSRAVRGVPLLVNCLVHASGMRGRATLVTVSDDAQVRTSAQARWNGDDERQTVSVEVVPKTSGWMNYTARVEPASNEDASTLSRQFTIYAEDRRPRILVLEGEPTWEAKFIRRALEKADLFDVDYFGQVSRAAMVGKTDEPPGTNEISNQTTDRSRPEVRLHEVLSSVARLNVYDCIILGPTPDSLLSSGEAMRLREWVERRGGGIIILGGNNFAGSIVGSKGKLASLVPAEIGSSNSRADPQTLARGAPVEAEKSQGQFYLMPTEAGKNGALRAFTIALEGSTAKDVLSGDGLRLGRLRLGSTVLAVKGKVGTPGTGDNASPFVASMQYGLGRSVVFAPADSWRMRAIESGDQSETNGPFASLWQGLTLWTGSNARPPVEIELSNDSPESDTELTAEIRLRDESYTPIPIEKLSAHLQQVPETGDDVEDTSSREISFVPDKNDPSIWRVRLNAPHVGKYDLQIKYTTKGKSSEVEKYFATVPPASIEEGTSLDTFQRTARETGGDLFTFASLNSLTDKLASMRGGNQFEQRTVELRSWWPLALIIPLLFSFEWLLIRLATRPRLASL